MMRRAPRTPKPGSSFVASTIGVGVAEAEAEDVAEAVEFVVLVGWIVEVTLKTEGTAVVIGMLAVPERLAEVIVTALVECRTVTLAELELERDADDWDAED